MPVAISGSYDVFERNYEVRIAPVTVEFCSPIRTAELGPEVRRQNLAEQVRSVIAETLGRHGSPAST